jgi:hypothetical protein
VYPPSSSISLHVALTSNIDSNSQDRENGTRDKVISINNADFHAAAFSGLPIASGYIHVYKYIHMHMGIHIYAYINMYTYTYTYMYIYTSIYIYVYIYINTHIIYIPSIITGVSIRSHGKTRKFNSYINNVNSSGTISVIHLGSILIPIKLDKSLENTNINNNLGVNNVINDNNENINLTNVDINILNSNVSDVRTSPVNTDRLVRTDSSVSTDRPVSNTAVVGELINRVVLPSIYLSKEVTLKVNFSIYIFIYIYTYIC